MNLHFTKNGKHEFEVISLKKKFLSTITQLKKKFLSTIVELVDRLLSGDAESEDILLAILSEQLQDKRAEDFQEYEPVATLELALSVD